MEELNFEKQSFISGLEEIEWAMKMLNRTALSYAGNGMIDDFCLNIQKDIQRAYYYFVTSMEKTKKIDGETMSKMHHLMLGGLGNE